MIRVLLVSFLLSIPCFSQTTTGDAQTKGTCSPANTGNSNTFIINCGIGREQGQNMLDILNKILANQINPAEVMAKLDEILKAVNPNLPTKAYFCNGRWRSTGPAATDSSNIHFKIEPGGDTAAFTKMGELINSRQYSELLKMCREQIGASPEWLTPYLFCGLAHVALGDKEKAREMLEQFDRKHGPVYDAAPCKKMTDFLRTATNN